MALSYLSSRWRTKPRLKLQQPHFLPTPSHSLPLPTPASEGRKNEIFCKILSQCWKSRRKRARKPKSFPKQEATKNRNSHERSVKRRRWRERILFYAAEGKDIMVTSRARYCTLQYWPSRQDEPTAVVVRINGHSLDWIWGQQHRVLMPSILNIIRQNPWVEKS